MDESLTNLFEPTKLTDKQARVYVALLQLGQATVSEVAEFAQLKRPNTYTVIAELEAIGYAHPIIGQSRKVYSATDPNKVVSELKRGVKSFEEMLPYLRAVQKKVGKPHVQYYSGLKGAQEAFAQIYRPKEARYATSIARARQTIPAEVARWQKTYLQGKARPGGKHLLTSTSNDREYATALQKGNQLVRYLQPGMSLNVDIALVEDTVFLTSFEDAIHVTVIKSSAIYEALCALYDLAWDNLSQK